MLANVAVDFSTPNSKKRANNCKIVTFNPAFGNFPDRAQTGLARAAKQVDQKSFDKVVGVMSEKNRLGASLFRYLRKKIVAHFASRGFDRDFLFGRERTHVGGSHFKIDIVLGSQFFDEVRIGIA